MRFDANKGVALAVLLGAITRFADIGVQSYSMDELWELTVVQLPAGEIVGAGDGFPPLFHLIFRGLVVGGFGDMIGRIFSATLGVLAVWLTARLGARISPAVGVGAAVAVALAPLLVLLSKEGRAYGLFILLAGLLLLATWNVIDSGTMRAWLGYGLVLVLGMYTHYMFALAVASAEGVLLWNLRGDRERMQHWVLAHAAMAVALVPLVLIAAPDFELDAANNYSPTVDISALGYAGLSLFTGFTLGPSTRALHTMDTNDAITSGLPWVILIGIPAGYLFYRGWKGLSEDWRIRLGVPLVTPLLLLTLFSAVVGVAFRVRYLSWLVIPLAIWLAVGYFGTKGTVRHIAAVTLLLVGVIAIVTRATVDDYVVEDARSAAAYIEEHPDTPAVAMVWYMTKPIEYYLGLDSATFLPADEGSGRFVYHEQLDNRLVPLPSRPDADSGMAEQREIFAAAVAVGEEYLFVRSREFHADPDGEYFAIRQATDNLVPVAEYAGITIYRGVRGE
ncbi:MAG: glycosyltransferase family 39 protein [Acidimicrobiia bacterium]|nr:glycosyltransferase family 39 protein [Acidimicrobiia bacterium]